MNGRRIRVDVEVSGGRVRIDLTEPTDTQLAEVNGLLEQWLNGPEAPAPTAASVPEEQPAEPESEIRRDLATEEGRGSAQRQSPTGRLVADVGLLLADLAEARADRYQAQAELRHEDYLGEVADKAIAERDAARAEVERLNLIRFLPTGDNHHNAAVCPYCSPGGADLAAQLRIAKREYAALKAAVEADLIEIRSMHPPKSVDRRLAALQHWVAAAVPTPTEEPTARCGARIRGLYGAETICQRPPHTDEHTPNDGIGTRSSTPEATTPEPETMRWDGGTSYPAGAHEIVAWCASLGGEARYVGDPASDKSAPANGYHPRIVITGPNDSKVIARPGDTIVKGTALIPQAKPDGTWAPPLREFTVSSPEAQS